MAHQPVVTRLKLDRGFMPSIRREILIPHCEDLVNQSDVVSADRFRIFDLVAGQKLFPKVRQVEVIGPHVIEQIVKGGCQVKGLLQPARLRELPDLPERKIGHLAKLFPLSIGEVHITFCRP